jgi:hypothetical protein
MVAAFVPMLTAAAPAIITAFGTAGAKALGDRAGKEAGNALFNANAGNAAANMPQVPSSVNQQRMIAMASQNQPALSSDEQRSLAAVTALAAQNQPAANNNRTLLGTVGDVVENAITTPPKLALGLVGNTLSGVGGVVSGVGNFLAGR